MPPLSTKLSTRMASLPKKVRQLYKDFGQRKQMGQSTENIDRPHFFLHRLFAGDQDLLVIFNTKKCSYQCHFCQLPAKCSKNWISGDHILAQFDYVMTEMKHSLSVLTRVTLSNEGSVLDTKTFPTDALLIITQAINQLKLVKRLVLETRLEHANPTLLKQLKQTIPRAVIDVLTGFETLDQHIKDNILFKDESLESFLSGLDVVAHANAELTSYILYKPSPTMTDEEAYQEASRSIDYLVNQCKRRNILLYIRLNPMYIASGSLWCRLARQTPIYKPPKLTDIMRLAQEVRKSGVGVYIGLSTEGLDEPNGSYTDREDYSSALIQPIKLFNDGRLNSFEGFI